MSELEIGLTKDFTAALCTRNYSKLNKLLYNKGKFEVSGSFKSVSKRTFLSWLKINFLDKNISPKSVVNHQNCVLMEENCFADSVSAGIFTTIEFQGEQLIEKGEFKIVFILFCRNNKVGRVKLFIGVAEEPVFTSDEIKQSKMDTADKLLLCGTPMINQHYNSLSDDGKAESDRKFKESLEKIRAARMQNKAPFSD